MEAANANNDAAVMKLLDSQADPTYSIINKGVCSYTFSIFITIK